MRKPIILSGLLLILLSMHSASAAVRVFACEPEWAALVTELAGDRAIVYTATTAQQDPHRIQARPSLIAKVRRADLVVCTGADLEAAWLPLLLRQAGNSAVMPGRPGYFSAADQVKKLGIPATLDRAAGDFHPQGNPHVHLDPRRLAIVGQALHQRLIEVDREEESHYSRRYRDFETRWANAMRGWEERAAPLRGMRVVAQHDSWVYLTDWLGLDLAAILEPRPGLPASPGHLAAIRAELETEPARAVLVAAYQDARAGEWLAERTSLRLVVLPFTVGGSEQARDLFGLFDDTVDRLLEAGR